MNFKGILILVLFISLAGCGGDEDLSCATFDMRQCNGNPWLEGSNNSFPESESEHANLLRNYLESQDIEATVEVDNDFHTVVCEACFVCPQGPRYDVRIPSEDTLKLRNLDLLNLTFYNCR